MWYVIFFVAGFVSGYVFSVLQCRSRVASIRRQPLKSGQPVIDPEEAKVKLGTYWADVTKSGSHWAD